MSALYLRFAYRISFVTCLDEPRTVAEVARRVYTGTETEPSRQYRFNINNKLRTFEEIGFVNSSTANGALRFWSKKPEEVQHLCTPGLDPEVRGFQVWAELQTSFEPRKPLLTLSERLGTVPVEAMTYGLALARQSWATLSRDAESGDFYIEVGPPKTLQEVDENLRCVNALSEIVKLTPYQFKKATAARAPKPAAKPLLGELPEAARPRAAVMPTHRLDLLMHAFASPLPDSPDDTTPSENAS